MKYFAAALLLMAYHFMNILIAVFSLPSWKYPESAMVAIVSTHTLILPLLFLAILFLALKKKSYKMLSNIYFIGYALLNLVTPVIVSISKGYGMFAPMSSLGMNWSQVIGASIVSILALLLVNSNGLAAYISLTKSS